MSKEKSPSNGRQERPQIPTITPSKTPDSKSDGGKERLSMPTFQGPPPPPPTKK